MSQQSTGTFCTVCKTPFTDPRVTQAGFVFTCAECGSNDYTRDVTVADEIGIRDQIKLKTKPGDRKLGERAVDIEVTSGSDFHRATGTWRQLWRFISRRQDLYHECITDDDGNLLVPEVKERLSEHRGHGQARRDHCP